MYSARSTNSLEHLRQFVAAAVLATGVRLTMSANGVAIVVGAGHRIRHHLLHLAQLQHAAASPRQLITRLRTRSAIER